ncbi:MAG: DUF3160 domain-containing protein, partial [Chitinispirillales bacterium]|nr:DUF3160 domain-containing protein [Chitinispirillales bacterium]
MKTIGMKKTLCLAAALAALCIAACKTGKTEESTAKNTGDGAYEEISAYHESDTGETEEPKARNMWGGIYGKIPAYYKDGLEPDAVNEKIKTRRAEDLGKLNGKYDSLKNDYLKKTLGRDLSRLSMNDLLTLHSGVYAVNGLLFKDNNLYSRFISKKGPIPWYADYMCYLLELEYWKKSKKIAASEKDVTLSAAEKEFVDKVDGRIAELRKNGMYVSKNGYTVGDIAHVVNMDMLKTWDKSYMDKLAQNNFVIAEMETGHLQLFHLYEQNDYRAMPSFVTTDLFLQAFHIYLSYALKVLEDKNFIPALEDLTFGLYKASMELSKSGDAEIAQIAEWNTVFYAV